ncbi:MAG: hypothetical protein H0V66_15070 [Bdellovibrionales bacterium]|nr:hypothetical protein [Bdellovibrionales bacterium]
MRYMILLLSFTLVGCSSLQRMAIRSASPMFVDGSNKLTSERNWEFFRDAAPGNLKFLEMVYLQDRDNLELLGTLVKGYAGYAYAVPETLAFGDDLAGVEDSIHKKNAIDHYTKSLDYGLDYLRKKGIKQKDLLGMDEDKLKKIIKDKLDKRDYTAVLFMAQSWGSLINLQKDNVALVSHVPKVKLLFDWVCGKDPSIENGVCDIFNAQYEASRPLMLGGNPAKAKQLYAAAIKERPRHLLLRLGFIQFSVLPAFDLETYETEAKILKEEFAKWENINRDTLEDTSDYKAVEHLNLYNAIARKRFEYIEKNKKRIFDEG